MGFDSQGQAVIQSAADGPQAQGLAQIVPLYHRQETIRGQQTMAWVSPANQAFHPRDAPLRQVHDRLIEKHHLTPLQSQWKLADQLKLGAAMAAVARGAAGTADMVPVAGRSCWVAPGLAKGVQDPGAAAAAVWVGAMARALQGMLGLQEVGEP